MSDTWSEFYGALLQALDNPDWKKGLDALFTVLRQRFLFDNVVIYRAEASSSLPEAVYARALGRGRRAEAEAAWGEGIANLVLSEQKIVHEPPATPLAEDRLANPHLLGLPFHTADGYGALIFVRFGGPPYTGEQIQQATLAAIAVAHLLDRHALRQTLSQLEAARHRAQLQDDFLAAISHDIHTPLGFIKGYTTSLLRSDTRWDEATQREFLTIIDEETDRLVTMLDRLLDSARLQQGMLPMEFQPVRLEALIRDVALRMQTRVPDLRLTLDLTEAPPLQADTVRLGQVLENLFDNALKYAPGAPVKITLQATPQKQTIVFADEGPGIPPQHLPFIFERFYRVPGESAARGTGLGLFICREIVRAHGGQISVETSPGKGTAFRIDLPVKPLSGMAEAGKQTVKEAS